jgi:hypothetical protein
MFVQMKQSSDKMPNCSNVQPTCTKPDVLVAQFYINRFLNNYINWDFFFNSFFIFGFGNAFISGIKVSCICLNFFKACRRTVFATGY